MSSHKSECKCTRCAAIAAGLTPEEALKAHLDNLKDLIDRVGVAVVGVGKDVENGIPDYYYSIGLTQLGHPEVIIFGLPLQYGVPAVNRFFAELKNGLITSEPQVIRNWFNLPVHIINVDDDAAQYFGNQAYQYYLKEDPSLSPKFVQMVLTDNKGVAPWEDDFENHFAQPVLNLEIMGVEPTPRVLH